MSFLANIINKIKSNFSTGHESKEPEYINEDYLNRLEEELIRADLGINLVLQFLDSIRSQLLTEDQVREKLKEFLLEAFDKAKLNKKLFKLNTSKDQLNIVLVVGVNGVGKTTSIGKLAHRFKQEGYKVLIAAGDTFRAAAEEQLNIWAERAAVDIVQLEPNSKASAVVYKAIEKAKAENYNMLIIDTAGRLQTKVDLMDELSKIKQVIEKNKPENSMVETILVLDSSTGSNALAQAEKFMEAAQLDSIILTKFDGTARAGIIFSIAYNFKLPVKFTGTGEGMEDIEEFDLDQFIAKYL